MSDVATMSFSMSSIVAEALTFSVLANVIMILESDLYVTEAIVLDPIIPTNQLELRYVQIRSRCGKESSIVSRMTMPL